MADGDGDGGSCRICLVDSIADVVRPVITGCGHLFCSPCLHEWFGMQRKGQQAVSCPTCKTPVAAGTITRLFGVGKAGDAVDFGELAHDARRPAAPAAPLRTQPSTSAPLRPQPYAPAATHRPQPFPPATGSLLSVPNGVGRVHIRADSDDSFAKLGPVVARWRFAVEQRPTSYIAHAREWVVDVPLEEVSTVTSALRERNETTFPGVQHFSTRVEQVADSSVRATLSWRPATLGTFGAGMHAPGPRGTRTGSVSTGGGAALSSTASSASGSVPQRRTQSTAPSYALTVGSATVATSQMESSAASLGRRTQGSAASSGVSSVGGSARGSTIRDAKEHLLRQQQERQRQERKEVRARREEDTELEEKYQKNVVDALKKKQPVPDPKWLPAPGKFEFPNLAEGDRQGPELRRRWKYVRDWVERKQYKKLAKREREEFARNIGDGEYLQGGSNVGVRRWGARVCRYIHLVNWKVPDLLGLYFIIHGEFWGSGSNRSMMEAVIAMDPQPKSASRKRKREATEDDDELEAP